MTLKEKVSQKRVCIYSSHNRSRFLFPARPSQTSRAFDLPAKAGVSWAVSKWRRGKNSTWDFNTRSFGSFLLGLSLPLPLFHLL